MNSYVQATKTKEAHTQKRKTNTLLQIHEGNWSSPFSLNEDFIGSVEATGNTV